MKPIFKEEKEFLERKLNVEIPVNSWRKGSKIYLNLIISPLYLSILY